MLPFNTKKYIKKKSRWKEISKYQTSTQVVYPSFDVHSNFNPPTAAPMSKTVFVSTCAPSRLNISEAYKYYLICKSSLYRVFRSSILHVIHRREKAVSHTACVEDRTVPSYSKGAIIEHFFIQGSSHEESFTALQYGKKASVDEFLIVPSSHVKVLEIINETSFLIYMNNVDKVG